MPFGRGTAVEPAGTNKKRKGRAGQGIIIPGKKVMADRTGHFHSPRRSNDVPTRLGSKLCKIFTYPGMVLAGKNHSLPESNDP